MTFAVYVKLKTVYVIMVAFFPRKSENTVKDHISNTKLEKGHHYYIQTRHKDIFSHFNLIPRKL